MLACAIEVDFRFESAHRLPNVPPEHKCARLHGHSFHCTVQVEGPLGETSGWVMDFATVKAAVEPVREALDHRLLNELPGLDNPTSERLAHWIWDRLAPALPELAVIIVRETCTSRCVLRREHREVAS